MKLHSDFHDYYDTAVGFGVDENFHYNRFTRKVAANFQTKLDFPKSSYDKKPLLLGFCGELYPLVRITEYGEDHRPKRVYHLYSYEDYVALMLATDSVIAEVKSDLWWLGHRETDKEIKKQLAKRLAKENLKPFFYDWRGSDDRLFRQHRTPVWLLDLDRYDSEITLDPKLADLGFERLKDPRTAFQEISMYVANILVEQKETATVEDKYRIEQHGFDSKSSFRKEKRS